MIRFREEVREIQRRLWSEKWLTLQLKDRMLKISFAFRLSEVKRGFSVFAGLIRHSHKFFGIFPKQKKLFELDFSRTKSSNLIFEFPWNSNSNS